MELETGTAVARQSSKGSQPAENQAKRLESLHLHPTTQDSPTASPSKPERVIRKQCRDNRVRFAPGLLQERYNTADGHPDHEGQTAQQRRELTFPWPQDLTPSNIRMLEIELGEENRASVERLKRRVGLLPPKQRTKQYVTKGKPAGCRGYAPPAETLHITSTAKAVAARRTSSTKTTTAVLNSSSSSRNPSSARLTRSSAAQAQAREVAELKPH